MSVKMFQLDWNITESLYICFSLYLFSAYIYFIFQPFVILKLKGEKDLGTSS